MVTRRRHPIRAVSGDPANCVFINCPFDAEYQSLFDSIVLTIVACGFAPRSAIESGTVSESRIDRIRKAIFGSRYSIHDLSRCRGQGDLNLARFNMPLELGIAMCRRFVDETSHDWLVLVPEGHQYLRFISDLGAFDPRTHKETAESIIPPIVNWLKSRPNAPPAPFPDQVVGKLPKYLEEIAELRRRSGGELPWSDQMVTAERHVRMRPQRVTVS